MYQSQLNQTAGRRLHPQSPRKLGDLSSLVVGVLFMGMSAVPQVWAQTAQNLPYAFGSGSAAMTSANGWSTAGLGSDYSDTTTPVKFDTSGDTATLRIASSPNQLTYYLKGNGTLAAIVFTVEQSPDGTSWTTIRTITSVTGSNVQYTDSLNSATRYLRWTYTTKPSGLNIGFGTITISAATTSSPTLSGAVGATVDSAFNVTFTDDATWRAAITSIAIGPTTLAAGYSVSAGQITFTPSASSPAALLQTNGTRTITVKATGYTDATVSQAIGFGAATKLGVARQPAAPTSNGGALATQPIVAVLDQYGNTNTSSSATVDASVGSGTWTLGGTASVNASSGLATFSGLTATSAAAVSGATLHFASGSLTTVDSSAFNIPAPPPANDNPAGAINLSLNAAAVSGSFSGSTPMTGATKNDVFYKFVAIGSSHTVTINNFSVAADKDLRIYASQPANYSDATVATGTSSSTTSETVNLTGLTPGNTYWILVLDFNTGGGTFDIAVTGYSSSSDIVADGGFSYPQNIAYATYQETDLTASSLAVAQFTLRDGGAGTDLDVADTTLTALSFTVANSSNLRRVALYDGSTELGEVAAGSTITFSGLSAVATDGGTKTLTLRASFQATVTDNQQFGFTVNSASASSGGSGFAAGNAGAAVSSTSGNNNRIVVSATKLAFSSVPTSVGVGATFSATVQAQDANNNLDLDSTASVTVSKQSGPGTLTGGDTANLAGGTRTVSALSLSTAGSVVLQAVDNGGSPLTIATTTIPVVPAPTLFDTFNDSDFTASPAWSGDTTSWTIVANSDVAAGATGSKTLRLSAPTVDGQTEHLRTQVADWGDSQEWGVWIGVRAQALTVSNKRYIWLYANEADLESATVDGYRLSIGEDTGDDEIRLERISNGAVAATVITSSGINNGVTDIGFLVRVTRNNAGSWTLYTSTLPTSSGNGAIATVTPDAINTTVHQGSATDATITPSANGYLGVAVLHSSGANAIAGTEFDQFYLTINHAPVAGNPVLGLRINESATVGVAKLAADSDGDSLTVTAASLASGSGSVSFTSSGITYNAPGTAGSASISYTVSDSRGGTATGSMAVTIRSANTSSTITDLDTSTEPGKVILTASGMPSHTYTVQVNDDNAGWVANGSATSAANGVLRYTNTVPGGVTVRLYRLAQ